MRHLTAERTGQFHHQAGFTLLEVIISVVLIGLIGTVVIRALDTNSRSSRTLDEQVQATNLATEYLEVIRQLPFDSSDPPYSSAGDNITIPLQFIVDIDTQYSSDGSNWTATYSGQKLQKVIIRVSREGGREVRSFCSYRNDFPGG